MGEGIVVIDLGDVAPADMPEDILPASSAGARRRRWRGFGTALVVLACLGLTGAGATQPALRGGFTIPLVRDWYTYDDNEIYMLSGVQEVTAYSLDDGRRLWRTRLPHEASYLNLRGGPIAVDDQGACSRLSRLDPATGAVSWTRTGVISGDQPPDGTLRIVRDLKGGCADGGGGAADGGDGPVDEDGDGFIDLGTLPQALDVVDQRTGAVRLSVPIKAGDQLTFGPAAATVAIWDRRGHLVERDLTTGAVLVSGDVPGLANAAGTLTNMMPSVWGFDDVWVVLDPPSLMADDVDAVVIAYDRRTLSPQWTVRIPAPSVDTRQYYGAWPCQPTVICLQIGETQTVGIDIDTGSRVPSPEWDVEMPVGSHWTIVADPDPPTGNPPAVLWDRRANRDAFPGWQAMSFNRLDLQKVVLSRTTGSGADVHTELAVFDGHAGRLHRLGATAGTYGSCDLTARRLFCVDDHVVLHVWPLRA